MQRLFESKETRTLTKKSLELFIIKTMNVIEGLEKPTITHALIEEALERSLSKIEKINPRDDLIDHIRWLLYKIKNSSETAKNFLDDIDGVVNCLAFYNNQFRAVARGAITELFINYISEKFDKNRFGMIKCMVKRFLIQHELIGMRNTAYDYLKIFHDKATAIGESEQSYCLAALKETLVKIQDNLKDYPGYLPPTSLVYLTLQTPASVKGRGHSQ